MHATHTTTATTPSTADSALPADADRIAALELYVQQLVFVLDAQGRLNADALGEWTSNAADRMQATGSAPAGTVAALRRLQAIVNA